MPMTKPGFKTTEFWLSLLTSLWAILGPSVPPVYQAVIPVVAGGLYSISRGLAKAGALRGAVGDYLKINAA